MNESDYNRVARKFMDEGIDKALIEFLQSEEVVGDTDNVKL